MISNHYDGILLTGCTTSSIPPGSTKTGHFRSACMQSETFDIWQKQHNTISHEWDWNHHLSQQNVKEKGMILGAAHRGCRYNSSERLLCPLTVILVDLRMKRYTRCASDNISPFSAALVSLRTSIRYRGLSGRNGSTTQHNRAGRAFNSSKTGHNVSVPAHIYKHMHSNCLTAYITLTFVTSTDFA